MHNQFFPTMIMEWYSEMGKKNDLKIIDLKIISIWRVRWETNMCVKRSFMEEIFNGNKHDPHINVWCWCG